jgi:transcriptional regulator with XRE-family HTH domain
MTTKRPTASQPALADDPFAALFQRAEQSERYFLELAKLEFTEEIIARMKAAGVNRAELARRMGAKPAFVTRLLSGSNNFELATMVKVARALNCEFRCHLQPDGIETQWLDFFKEEPERPAAEAWQEQDFKSVSSSSGIPQTAEVQAA